MKLCSRCQKRPAVIYINEIRGENVTSRALCLRCVKELKINPFFNYIEKMGIKDEDMDLIESQIGETLEGLQSPDGAPFDLSALMGSLPPVPIEPESDQEEKKEPQNRKNTANNTKKKKNSMLENYCTDLTARAADGKLDRVIGRDTEMERVIQILCRRQKNNPCLIGEPGVGKTAIAELLAQRIADGKVPVRLMDKEVHLLDITAMVAGTHFRGQFESRVKALVDEVKKAGNVILVIDEVHTIVGAGDSEGGMSCANILKPALSRGEIQLIGATTLSEYRKNIEKDQALERRFQPVMVEEPTVAKTLEILKGIKKHYESFHGLKVPDEVLRHAVTLSERYITDRFLPDKAIDILDEACAKKAVDSPVVQRIDRLVQLIRALTNEREELESKSDPGDATYARLAEIKVKEGRYQEELQALSRERDGLELTLSDVAAVIEAWTGIPAEGISENEYEKIARLEGELNQKIIGQETAVNAVCRAIKRHRAGIHVKKKPASFIFAGPTGVGKTELVKRLAEGLFDSNEALIRLDMSEFMEKHSVSRIIGSPPGYVGYDDAGQLTEKIRRKPYSVVLFDEIEKAHPDVLNVLLQILDDGKVKDAHGKEINFENTVIVMTTNAGSQVQSGVSGFGHSLHEGLESRTMKGLESFLRPEFLNRVDEIITFSGLTRENFDRIARLRLSEIAAVLAEKGYRLSFDEDVCRHVAESSFSEKFGARNMARLLQKEIEDPLAEAILSQNGASIQSLHLQMEGDRVEICPNRN